MRTMAFMRRNGREILRDPLTMVFGIGFPVILLGLMTLIARRAPVEIFQLEKLVPGVAAFGFSFISLFSATLISRDRSSALMMRLVSSPLRPEEFIMGYTLPLVPMAAAQCAICFLAARVLGLGFSWRTLACMAALLPAALIYIALGLMCGSLLTDKQVGGICGALLTNLTAWMSGIWFDLELIGGGFAKAARMLPFANAVDAARAALAGDWSAMARPLAVVSAYAVAGLMLAAMIFARRMRRQ